MAVATSFAQAAGFGFTVVIFPALQIVSDRTGGVRMLAMSFGFRLGSYLLDSLGS